MVLHLAPYTVCQILLWEALVKYIGSQLYKTIYLIPCQVLVNNMCHYLICSMADVQNYKAQLCHFYWTSLPETFWGEHQNPTVPTSAWEQKKTCLLILNNILIPFLMFTHIFQSCNKMKEDSYMMRDTIVLFPLLNSGCLNLYFCLPLCVQGVSSVFLQLTSSLCLNCDRGCL
ncbi:hypothetical protein AALO_G00265930 [Alosa alosa]|uniref:Uncharacterized protein n=1 Tax=Alosa alosa TaxID=278164 RepID=A0AAV6FKY7_9TELE|nr:hypothetical protein AALO_G00265930 [Alosa alosa]